MWPRPIRYPSSCVKFGRLREISFRAVGEGTGREIDLDRFDRDYRHLFLWRRDRAEVVGAYRLGLTDEIMDKRGLNGCTPRSLFRYGHPFSEPYQSGRRAGDVPLSGRNIRKRFNPFSCCGKVSGASSLKTRVYRILFGPVSITCNYRPASRHLIATYFDVKAKADELSGLIHPAPPLAPNQPAKTSH